MAQWFFYDENGYRIGPLDDVTLKNLALDGTLSPDSIVETESGKKAKAESIKGLTFISHDLNSDYFVPPPLPVHAQNFASPASGNSSGGQEAQPVQSAGPNAANAPVVIDPKNWGSGAWLTLLSAGLAILSFILPWQDIGIISASGFRLGTFCLGIFFAYPVWASAANRLMNKIVAYLCSALGIVSGIVYIPLQCHVKMFDEKELIAGTGVYTIIGSSILLAVGIFFYHQTDSATVECATSPDAASNANLLRNPKITAALGFAAGLLVMFALSNVDFQRPSITDKPAEKPRFPFAEGFEEKEVEPEKKMFGKELVVFYEEKKRKLDRMKQFKILSAKFYFEKERFMVEPVIDLSVKNNSNMAISSVSFHGKLSSPNRTIPWVEADFTHSIPGGLEADEATRWKIDPGIFDGWQKAPKDRHDMIFEVEVKSVTFADGTKIESSVFTQADAEKLQEARNQAR